MQNWNLRAYRNDLSIFTGLIKAYNIEGDFKELDDVVSTIGDAELLEYSFEKICFYINSTSKGTKPKEIKKCQLFFENKIMIKDKFDVEDDPLFDFKFELNILGYVSSEESSIPYKNCWHLDQHYSDSETHNTHPSYHFHFGGKKVKEITEGELMVLSAPRIPHPPMDIFLSVHFILSNFFDLKREPIKSLFDNEDYKMVIRKAQKRLWTPYFSAFDSACSHNQFTISNVFPLFLN